MRMEIDEEILADADAFNVARQGKLTATPAVHATSPAAAVMDEGDEAGLLRCDRDAACLRLARHELTISTLRIALAMVAREAGRVAWQAEANAMRTRP